MSEKASHKLVTITFVVSDDQGEDEASGVSPLVQEITNAILETLEARGPEVEWVSTAYGPLPTEKSGRCVNCGAWTTNYHAQKFVPPQYSFLSVGAIHKGRLLCDLCLSEEHPLHF